MAGLFEIEKSNDGKYYFRLRSSAGTVLLFSETYTAKATAKDSIASVKTNAPYDFRYVRSTSTDNRYYFTLKAGNGETLGLSLLHDTAYARDKAIEETKSDAPLANTVDLT